MSMSAMGLLDIRLGCRLIRCSPFLGHPGNCNILENVYAITYIFVLQLSVLLLCNKQTDERNYYAESYIALIEAIIKETASIIKDIKKAMGEV